MPQNQILAFANGAGANVMTPADYAALAAVLTGFQSGVAKSIQFNTVLRQASFVAAMLAQFTANNSGEDVLDDGDAATLLANFQDALTEYIAGGFPRSFSITDIPTSNAGPVIGVIEAGEIWPWVSTAFFTGYRSPLCGRPLDGHTTSPLAHEIDAVGATFSKTTYARLWAYAQENGLVVASGSWVAGTHNFVDLGASGFQAPDLRNMFRRYTGTDADTANVRALGSRQGDAIQQMTGMLNYLLRGTTAPGVSGVFVNQNTPTLVPGATGTNNQVNQGVNFDASRVARTSSETRPASSAYCPRMHA